MKKILLLITLVAAIGGGLYLAKLNGSLDSTNSPSASSIDFSANIPADTLFWALNTSPISTQALLNSKRDPSTDMVLEELKANGPETQLFAHIATNWLQSGTQGVETFQNQWGFGNEFQSAIYTVGLIPVVEFSLANPAQFVKQIDAAATQSGITKTEEKQADYSISSYALPNEDIAGLALIIKQTKNTVRITFDGPFDAKIKELVMGTKLPSKTLDSQNALEIIRKQHNFKGNVLAAVQWDNLASMFTTANSTGFTMLNSLSQGEAATEFSDIQSKECQAEVATLVQFAPRTLVSNQVDIKDGRIASEGAILLELTNSWLTGNLSQLNGVLPSFTLADDYKPMLGFALGLNIAELNTVLADVWAGLEAYKPSCAPLQELQAKLTSSNPVNSLSMLGLVPTVKGLSITVNDLDFNIHNEMPQLSKVSAVISLSSISSAKLIALAQQFQPMLAAMNIPTDGTSLPLQLPIPLPGMPELEISVQSNKHIVISTTDELAKKQAKSMAKQDLTSNGITMMSVQSKPFTNLLQKVQKQMSTGLLGSDSVDGSTCAELNLYTAAAMTTDINLSVVTKFQKTGLNADIKESQLLKKVSTPFSPGKYKVWQIVDGCHKVIDGEDTFNADGSGSLSSVIDQAQCDGYNGKYDWKNEAGKLVFNFKEEQYRSSCTDALSDWAPVTKGENRKSDSCFIFNETATSFSCIFVTDEIPTQYDFQKI